MTEFRSGAPTVANWAAVWESTAARLQAHWAAGRGHLLTEDAMRMCLIQALAEFDVGPSRLSAEVYAPALGRGKVDLCIDGHTGTVIELKFPRDSATDAGAADTMIFGELLRDFCRVAVVDSTERWVAQIIHARLARYLAAATTRYGVEWATKPGETMALTREALQRLPKVSLVAIGDTPWRLPVRATCTSRVSIVDGLVLYAYRVDAPTARAVDASPLIPATPLPAAIPPRVNAPRLVGRQPGGARAAILAAMDDITATTGRQDVSIADVLAYLRARNTPYADSTIRTMMSSHMRADRQGPGIDALSDLDLVDRGLYRRRR